MDCDLEETKATKEKSADKMFEELGYEDSPVGYGAKRYGNNKYHISFYKKQIMFTKMNTGDSFVLEPKELQAINKKVEELGWK